MKALLSKLFGWFRRKNPPEVVVTKGSVVTDFRPKQLYYAESGPIQMELFDDDEGVIKFLKECGVGNIKVEVITPVKEGKKAVVFRRIIKTPVV